jgi:hypothetical protein
MCLSALIAESSPLTAESLKSNRCLLTLSAPKAES